MFIDSARAESAAETELALHLASADPLFEPLRASTIGGAVLVKDILGDPSYWLVPLEIEGRTAGFARVLGSGEVSALGVFYSDPSRIGHCPKLVTGIDAGEASRRAAEAIDFEKGETASEPVFVHDGPRGREAWLIEVAEGGIPRRWIFVTAAFTYERAAGELLDDAVE